MVRTAATTDASDLEPGTERAQCAAVDPRPSSSESAARGERILHVTEALAAGVGLSVARLATLQAAAGIRPTVVGLRRYDTPDVDELRRWFGADVELIVYPRSNASRLVQLAWLSSRLVQLLASRRYEVLHLHSSFAGAVGRLIAAPFSSRVRTFYSPHGFAFLRSDLGSTQRRLILVAERLLALLPSRLVLVSTSELDVARRHVSRRAEVLENGIDLADFAEPQVHAERARPLVVMVGRITEQKAPWRFAMAAASLGDRADFRWLGYGPAMDIERWFGGTAVEVSGRLNHAELLLALQQADLVYFPTLWEGMPLSLIEAQASGLPVVASDIEGNRDVVIDGVTGYLRVDDDELIRAVATLIDSNAERKRMAAAAAAHAGRFSDALRGRRSFALYGIEPARQGLQ